jgi:hypothetical protein
MLNAKILFLILGHEECVICYWRGYLTKLLPGNCMLFICQWRRICGGLMVIWDSCMDIYISHLIFSVGLALDWNTLVVNCRLAWNLLFHGCIQNGRGGGTRPFIHFCFLFHSAALFGCDHKIVLFVLFDQKTVLYCDFVLSYNV